MLHYNYDNTLYLQEDLPWDNKVYGKWKELSSNAASNIGKGVLGVVGDIIKNRKLAKIRKQLELEKLRKKLDKEREAEIKRRREDAREVAQITSQMDKEERARQRELERQQSSEIASRRGRAAEIARMTSQLEREEQQRQRSSGRQQTPTQPSNNSETPTEKDPYQRSLPRRAKLNPVEKINRKLIGARLSRNQNPTTTNEDCQMKLNYVYLTEEEINNRVSPQITGTILTDKQKTRKNEKLRDYLKSKGSKRIKRKVSLEKDPYQRDLPKRVRLKSTDSKDRKFKASFNRPERRKGFAYIPPKPTEEMRRNMEEPLKYLRGRNRNQETPTRRERPLTNSPTPEPKFGFSREIGEVPKRETTRTRATPSKVERGEGTINREPDPKRTLTPGEIYKRSQPSTGDDTPDWKKTKILRKPYKFPEYSRGKKVVKPWSRANVFAYKDKEDERRHKIRLGKGHRANYKKSGLLSRLKSKTLYNVGNFVYGGRNDYYNDPNLAMNKKLPTSARVRRKSNRNPEQLSLRQRKELTNSLEYRRTKRLMNMGHYDF